MFFTPYFGGCKYTNKFLFINKIIVFQHFDLLISSFSIVDTLVSDHLKRPSLPHRINPQEAPKKIIYDKIYHLAPDEHERNMYI